MKVGTIMKYVIYSLLALLICILVGITTVVVINKLRKTKLKKYMSIIIATVVTLFCLVIVFVIFICDNYKASKKAKDYLVSTDTVTVTKTDFGYFFDGKGTKDCIIFYPGAKVQIEAYSCLMMTLAEEGVDAFLIKMPLNLAALGNKKADLVINNYEYDNYYISGHSLGGVEASKYAKNNDKIKGIIYLASYSTVKLDDNLKVLSLYGTCDKVLNKKEYKSNKKNFPSNFKEVVIDGGNHEQFGLYKQKGDGKPTISYIEQLNITKEEIIKLINE